MEVRGQSDHDTAGAAARCHALCVLVARQDQLLVLPSRGTALATPVTCLATVVAQPVIADIALPLLSPKSSKCSDTPISCCDKLSQALLEHLLGFKASYTSTLRTHTLVA